MRSIKYIGIDIGKRNCYVCVKDEEGNVLEETSYANLYGEALKYATEAKAKYGQCKAVCESTGNLWTRTADAFEKDYTMHSKNRKERYNKNGGLLLGKGQRRRAMTELTNGLLRAVRKLGM